MHYCGRYTLEENASGCFFLKTVYVNMKSS